MFMFNNMISLKDRRENPNGTLKPQKDFPEGSPGRVPEGFNFCLGHKHTFWGAALLRKISRRDR